MAKLSGSDCEGRRLCSACVGDEFLRNKINSTGEDGECFYCGGNGKTFSLGQLADEVEIALDEHFYRTPPEPNGYEYVMMKETDYDWKREGDLVADVIAEYANIDEKPAGDIHGVLSAHNYDQELAEMGDEQPFDMYAQYAETGTDDSESQAGWLNFERSLKTEGRFFSKVAEATLVSVFEGIAEHGTDKSRPTIVDAGPGTELPAIYRARVFQSDRELEEALKRPDREIGPPPPLAALAGRMNPHGIAVFYGATDTVAALSEVRPPVGSRVAIGRFDLIRRLRLLDVEALRSVNVSGSIFDRGFGPRSKRAKFLKWLSNRISMPVMPNEEPLSYLATQAIADFLATSEAPALDGILYPSAQGTAKSLNVVLFHKAARVERLDIPEGTTISAYLADYTEDGPEINYWVSEETPPTATTEPADDDGFPSFSGVAYASDPADYDGRVPTLRLDASSVAIHHVSAVSFKSESYSVLRHRSEKRKEQF